ncbi:MAG: citrate lyase subunit alpha [Candidatus Krumholzibacteria bacterium]|jgi:citrate lyase subunit alpha/citrate CoA-transferase|nr:citrate lyase subunit alpha [Candidatus Krumholzibacteria bacterium]MDP6797389.1 citrate lyase subunit alpha [Candidatus Krumholzibacteria bacterium]
MSDFVKNAAGRSIPKKVNGVDQVPFQGVGKHPPLEKKAAAPNASCQDFPADGDKRVSSLREALEKCGLRDGMTISNHHHFRNGDRVMTRVFDAAAEMGVQGLTWFPSAAFPCHEPVIEHMKNGVVKHVEGSLNGPLGDYASSGEMDGVAVLRSHGGRWQAVQDGEVHIDIAIIAAPTADSFGNATGDRGPSACGSLNFGLVDSLYADKTIVVTDNLVDFPCIPWQIQGNQVDYVVELEEIGDPAKIVSGTTQITKSPDRLLIADLTARFIRSTSLYRDGFSMQAGAGGTALAMAIYLRDMMREDGIHARFIRGGSTKYLVEMLEEGLTDFILDGQTFDLEGVRSLRENWNHVATSPYTSYNWHGKGNFASLVDFVVLGATEVDRHFNANVVTHSDGRMLHGIGGWQNCLFANTTILPIPSFRDRIPVLVDEVTTLCGPGELIDVIVSERGIAINPLREDLIEETRNSGLPIRSFEEIQEEVEKLCGGKPEHPEFTEEVIGIVKWVDGTVMDSIFKVKS